MSTTFDDYRSPDAPIPATTWAWNMYGAGVEHIGSHGKPELFEVPEPGDDQLLVRVDATESDGWFYEGAGIYRHVWLVKTSPVHVPRWGTFVKADVGAGAASLAIRTDVVNHDKTAQKVRVVSTVLGPSG